MNFYIYVHCSGVGVYVYYEEEGHFHEPSKKLELQRKVKGQNMVAISDFKMTTILNILTIWLQTTEWGAVGSKLYVFDMKIDHTEVVTLHILMMFGWADGMLWCIIIEIQWVPELQKPWTMKIPNNRSPLPAFPLIELWIILFFMI